jgi:hypothetical protein
LVVHGNNRIRINGFDVASLDHAHVRMPQDGLNHLVRHSETMQVRRQSSAEGMPPVPLDSGLFQCRPDDVTGKIIQTARISMVGSG